jgi:hypothetical protein
VKKANANRQAPNVSPEQARSAKAKKQNIQVVGPEHVAVGIDPLAPTPVPGHAPSAAVLEDAPLPYVPENELDYSIDYGKYTFNSKDFEHAHASDDGQPNSYVPEEQGFVGASSPGTGASEHGPAIRARLMDTTENRVYDLMGSHISIGREQNNDIVLKDVNASRNHAELRLGPQGVWSLSDLGSTNGTLVNGQDTTSHFLSDGDCITIGMTNYIFMQS